MKRYVRAESTEDIRRKALRLLHLDPNVDIVELTKQIDGELHGRISYKDSGNQGKPFTVSVRGNALQVNSGNISTPLTEDTAVTITKSLHR